MDALNKTALQLAREALEDDERWPPAPWVPDIDDPGTVDEDWTGKWYVVKSNGKDSTVDANSHSDDYGAHLARFIAAMRLREPMLARAVIAQHATIGAHVVRWEMLNRNCDQLIAQIAGSKAGEPAPVDASDALRIAQAQLAFVARFRHDQPQATAVADWLKANGDHSDNRDSRTILARAVVSHAETIRVLRGVLTAARRVVAADNKDAMYAVAVFLAPAVDMARSIKEE